ncbi:uncharacterized protein LOC131591033 [Poecile atricapillus]|uniref:uncharacterized protein LOC131591033 n=1 Tax=Poecile atricapillus TaxID=48891 RepID=UPI0027396AB7|nr:uncharacterized protein LOC131591033 [Poecile atricapillus]
MDLGRVPLPAHLRVPGGRQVMLLEPGKLRAGGETAWPAPAAADTQKQPSSALGRLPMRPRLARHWERYWEHREGTGSAFPPRLEGPERWRRRLEIAPGVEAQPHHLPGLIQAALEKGEAPEHLQYIDDIIVCGNTAAEVFEKGEKIIQILLEAAFIIKKNKVKRPAHEIHFLGVKWRDGRRQIPTDVINKITAMSPPANNKLTQAFLGAIGFWRMHIPEYSQIMSPLYLVTRKKNDFHWGPEQQQAFA